MKYHYILIMVVYKVSAFDSYLEMNTYTPRVIIYEPRHPGQQTRADPVHLNIQVQKKVNPTPTLSNALSPR